MIKMKIFGIAAGRKNGNSEILLKEALLAAEERGAETSWVNLHDAEILPCTGCEACMMQLMKKRQPPVCVVHKGKDDMDTIMDEMARADGIIVSVPTFCLAPQGIWKVFTDRWLPYEWALQKKLGAVDHVPERVAGIIACGGATLNWQPLSLALLNIPLFMQSIKVVDMVLSTQVARPGQVILKPEAITQAGRLGLNVAEACAMDFDNVEYVGERKGWCPVCHHNLMIKAEPHWNGVSFKYECAMCGAGGDLVPDSEGNLEFVLAENGLEHCRIFTEGRENHVDELGLLNKEFFENMDEVKAGTAKYKEYQSENILKG